MMVAVDVTEGNSIYISDTTVTSQQSYLQANEAALAAQAAAAAQQASQQASGTSTASGYIIDVTLKDGNDQPLTLNAGRISIVYKTRMVNVNGTGTFPVTLEIHGFNNLTAGSGTAVINKTSSGTIQYTQKTVSTRIVDIDFSETIQLGSIRTMVRGTNNSSTPQRQIYIQSIDYEPLAG